MVSQRCRYSKWSFKILSCIYGQALFHYLQYDRLPSSDNNNLYPLSKLGCATPSMIVLGRFTNTTPSTPTKRIRDRLKFCIHRNMMKRVVNVILRNYNNFGNIIKKS